MNRLLIINPGSTTTKAAVYHEDQRAAKVSIHHSADELASFSHVNDQAAFRRGSLDQWLEEEGLLNPGFSAVVGRGGLLQPIPSGTYLINEAILDDLKRSRFGQHASNLGAVLAATFQRDWSIPAFIADPVVVDELQPLARYSGSPRYPRRSIFHALNQKAAARRAAAHLGRAYQELNLIIVHLGGGISVGSHRRGQVVDVNNALDGEGPLSPERAGTLPTTKLIRHIFRTKISRPELYSRLVGGGGLVGHLGTNDGREIEKRVRAGDEQAKLFLDVLAYQVSKEVGRCAAVLQGKIDSIVFTGGLAHSSYVIQNMKTRCQWIAPIMVLPGENELEALALAGLRVLRGEEQPRDYPTGRFGHYAKRSSSD